VPFPEAQIAAVIELCQGILARHPIPPERVLAHSDVAPLRKIDPGEFFPWERLSREGIGLYVPPVPWRDGPTLSVGAAGAEVAALKDRFRTYGYGLYEADEFDAGMAGVVTAFQRHFRPGRIDGVADLSTRETLERLIAALPVAAN
jgi:N-acetylmuramoyl-L-alanine amidase